MLLLGLLAFTTGSRGLPAYGITAFLGSLGITAIATVAAFGVLAMLQARRARGRDRATSAVWRTAPRRRRCSSRVAVATLAGIPPLAGFLSRVLLITSAADAHYGWLAIVASAATLLTIVAAARFIGCSMPKPVTRCRSPSARRRRSRASSPAPRALRASSLAFLIQPLLAVATAGAGPLR